VQLSIWVAAQFNKLNALSGKRVSIGIPLVSVEGHDWRIYIAYQKENDDIVSNTNSPCGICLRWYIDYMGQRPLRRHFVGLGNISDHCWYSGISWMELYKLQGLVWSRDTESATLIMELWCSLTPMREPQPSGHHLISTNTLFRLDPHSRRAFCSPSRRLQLAYCRETSTRNKICNKAESKFTVSALDKGELVNLYNGLQTIISRPTSWVM